MAQLHKRLTDEQVSALFSKLLSGALSRTEIQTVLEIGITRFFTLLKVFREVHQNKIIRPAAVVFTFHKLSKVSTVGQQGCYRVLLF
jgi:hypothetical protein